MMDSSSTWKRVAMSLRGLKLKLDESQLEKHGSRMRPAPPIRQLCVEQLQSRKLYAADVAAESLMQYTAGATIPAEIAAPNGLKADDRELGNYASEVQQNGLDSRSGSSDEAIAVQPAVALDEPTVNQPSFDPQPDEYIVPANDIRGDVNRDGSVTALDLVMVANAINAGYSIEQAPRADVNEDSQIDQLDFTSAIQAAELHSASLSPVGAVHDGNSNSYNAMSQSGGATELTDACDGVEILRAQLESQREAVAEDLANETLPSEIAFLEDLLAQIDASIAALEDCSGDGSDGATDGSSEGTTGGSSEGTTFGTTEGSTAGSTDGSTFGSTEGSSGTSTQGSTQGSTEASTSGSTYGSTNASTSGSSEGSTSGSTEGSTYGSTYGSTQGSTESSTSGSTYGTTQGSTQGSTSGSTYATTNGSSGGTTFGSTAGSTVGSTDSSTSGSTDASTHATTSHGTSGSTYATTHFSTEGTGLPSFVGKDFFFGNTGDGTSSSPVEEGGWLRIEGHIDGPRYDGYLVNPSDLHVSVDRNFDGDYDDEGETQAIEFNEYSYSGWFEAYFEMEDDGPWPGNGTPEDNVNVRLSIDDDLWNLSQTVRNVPPRLTAHPELSWGPGSEGNIAATVLTRFYDPGIHDSHTVTVILANGDSGSLTIERPACDPALSYDPNCSLYHEMSVTVETADNGMLDPFSPDADTAVASIYPITIIVADDDQDASTGDGATTYVIMESNIEVNSDDNDANGVPDRFDKSARASTAPEDDPTLNEDDMVAFSIGDWITDEMTSDDGEFRLSCDFSKIRVWDSPEKNHLLTPVDEYGYDDYEAHYLVDEQYGEGSADTLLASYEGADTVWIEGFKSGLGLLSLVWADTATMVFAGMLEAGVSNGLDGGEMRVSEYFWGHFDETQPAYEVTGNVLWRHNEHYFEVGINKNYPVEIKNFQWIAYPWEFEKDRTEATPQLPNDPDEIKAFRPQSTDSDATATPEPGDWAVRAMATDLEGNVFVSKVKHYAVLEVTGLTWESSPQSPAGVDSFEHSESEPIDWFWAEKPTPESPVEDRVNLRVTINPAVPQDIGDVSLTLKLLDPDNRLGLYEGWQNSNGFEDFFAGAAPSDFVMADMNDYTFGWARDNLAAATDANKNPRKKNFDDYDTVDGYQVPNVRRDRDSLTRGSREIAFLPGVKEVVEEVFIPNRQPGNNYRAIIHDNIAAIYATNFRDSTSRLEVTGGGFEANHVYYSYIPDSGSQTQFVDLQNRGKFQTSRDLTIRRTLHIEHDYYRQPYKEDVVNYSDGYFSDSPGCIANPTPECDDHRVLRHTDMNYVQGYLRAILQPASIDVSYSFFNSDEIGFRHNASDSELIDDFEKVRDLENEDAFWSVQIADVYELEVTKDGDPDTSKNTYGRTNLSHAVSFVATESVRDIYALETKLARFQLRPLYDFQALVAVHEVMHNLLGGHKSNVLDIWWNGDYEEEFLVMSNFIMKADEKFENVYPAAYPAIQSTGKPGS